MAEQRSDNMSKEMEEEGFKILQKIEDMIVYALPLIEKWSIPHQKLLGDDIAHCMNQMSQLASALTVAYYKKTSISELDETNKALQSYIRVAYRLKYLKGTSSRNEWEGRSTEIGKMIGKYKEWVYGDNQKSSQPKSGKTRYSR
ncbi:MAG: four helix bundle protein [Eubacteriales bacterium]|nr:four helix bundle protein [Eubacteriales bacterium]